MIEQHIDDRNDIDLLPEFDTSFIVSDLLENINRKHLLVLAGDRAELENMIQFWYQGISQDQLDDVVDGLREILEK